MPGTWALVTRVPWLDIRDLESRGMSLQVALCLPHKGEAACPLDLHLGGKLVPGCHCHGSHSLLKLAAKPVLSLEDHYEDQRRNLWQPQHNPSAVIPALFHRHMNVQALGMGIILSILGSSLTHPTPPPSIPVALGILTRLATK